MAMTKKDIFALTAGAILLVGVTAGASAYYLNNDERPDALHVGRYYYIQGFLIADKYRIKETHFFIQSYHLQSLTA